MDLGLLAEVAGLGLAAVDVVGIAFMPILLAQRDGLRRALVFLLGSFVALMTMGIIFTTGVGSTIAGFNERHPWLEPGVQVLGGLFLIGAGIFMLVRVRRGAKSHAPDELIEKLQLPIPLLFAFGVALVTVQSLVDIVFAVAMVDIGAQGLGVLENVLLVLVYTLSALVLQSAVVVGYLLVPQGRRVHVMARFTDWLASHGEFWAGIAALLVGAWLLFHSTPELARGLGG